MLCPEPPIKKESGKKFSPCRPNFSQPSSRIALVFQLVWSRTIVDLLYYDWITRKKLDGLYVTNGDQRYLRQSTGISDNILLYLHHSLSIQKHIV